MVSAVNLTSLRRVWHLCNLPSRAYTLFRFVCIARYVLRLYVLSLQGQRFTYSVNIYIYCLVLAFYIVTLGPAGYLIRTVGKHSALHEYDIYLRPAFLQTLPTSEVPNEGYYRNPFISSLDDKWACAKVFSVNF